MLSLGAGARRVYLAIGATDLRKGYDGLYGLVRSRLEEDPMSGPAFRVLQRGTHAGKGALFRRERSVAVCQATGPGSF